jgi:hypothetical protein
MVYSIPNTRRKTALNQMAKATHKKITRSHTSAIEKADEVVSLIQKLPEVTKISLGIIKHIGVGKPAVKFHPITGGFKAVIRGNISIQEIFVYTKDEMGVQKKIKSLF